MGDGEKIVIARKSGHIRLPLSHHSTEKGFKCHRETACICIFILSSASVEAYKFRPKSGSSVMQHSSLLSSRARRLLALFAFVSKQKKCEVKRAKSPQDRKKILGSSVAT